MGDVTVTRVNEMVLNGFRANDLIPDYDPSFLEKHKEWLLQGNMEEDLEHVIVSVGTWIVKTPQHTILIGTATGTIKIFAVF